MLKFFNKKSLYLIMIAMAIPYSWACDDCDDIPVHHLTTLPSDVMHETISYLDIAEVTRLSCVSKFFQELCDQDLVWADRVPGAKTKQDVVFEITRPIVQYENNQDTTITISGYDVHSFVKTGGFFVGDTFFKCQPLKKLNLTPKGQVLYFLKHEVILEKFAPLELVFREEGAMLRDSRFVIRVQLDFAKALLNNPYHTLISPAPVGNFVDTPQNRAQWMISTLTCLDEHYAEMCFNSFWGVERVFDYLEQYLSFLHTFSSLEKENKDHMVHFFVQKYADFRQKKIAIHGDCCDADAYLRKLLSSIRDGFGTNFVSTAYVPPLSYVVENDAIPADIKNQYIG